MKRKIAFHLVFCLIVIFCCKFYFESKTSSSIAYFHAEQYVADKYEIDVSELIPGEIEYYYGLGLYVVEVINNVANQHYYFEVDIRKDYSLFYFKEITDFGK